MRYPWHPWYQKTILTRKPTRHRGSSVYLCMLEGSPPESAVIHIPRWMFEASECDRMSVLATPQVRCENLRALHELISTQLATWSSMVQPVSSWQPAKGESDEKSNESWPSQTVDVVHPRSAKAELAGSSAATARRGAAVTRSTDGQHARRLPGKNALKRGRTP